MGLEKNEFFDFYRFFHKQLVAVRVPHNLSRRVLQFQTPIRRVGRLLAVAGSGFAVKPTVFLTISVAGSIKPIVF